MTSAIVYVHGHGCKPPADTLADIWTDALRAGLQRDHAGKLPDFEAADKRLVYFGDLNNALWTANNTAFDPRLDAADRRNAIDRLRTIAKAKKFNRYQYESIPGKSAVREVLADIGAPLLGKTGLIGPVLERIMPELAEYWDVASEYYQESSKRMLSALTGALDGHESVMLIAHGIGGVVAYDALWKLSYGTGELASRRDRKIDRLLTLGTPLADDTVRSRLAGMDAPVAERYPCNVLNWYNIAAEDDYICHDKTVADDFRAMLAQHLISVIEDYRIYNLTVRYGKSNPHSVIGYLVHPRVSGLVANWL